MKTIILNIFSLIIGIHHLYAYENYENKKIINCFLAPLKQDIIFNFHDLKWQSECEQTFRKLSNEQKKIVEVLIQEIESLSNHSAFLDIGAGNGFITNQLAEYFKITYAVEHKDFLANQIPSTNTTVVFNDSWQNICEFFDIKSDFILLSHMLYSVRRSYFNYFMETVFKKLNNNGKIAIVLTSPITEHPEDKEKKVYYSIFDQFPKHGRESFLKPNEVKEMLLQEGYQLESKIFYPKISTKDKVAFIKAFLFLLIKNYQEVEYPPHEILDYIETLKKDNEYTLYIPQELIVVSKRSLSKRDLHFRNTIITPSQTSS